MQADVFRFPLQAAMTLAAALFASFAADAQPAASGQPALPSGGGAITSNPLPAPIATQGLAVEIVEIARLPDSRGMIDPADDAAPRGTARISFVVDAPDGRRFANDQRGLLYHLPPGGPPRLYLDIREAFPRTIYNRLQAGLNAFAFHPDFAANGLFYTVHGEFAEDNPTGVDFIPPGFGQDDVTHHNVITEWRADDPRAANFAGARRELLRVAHVTRNMSHPFGFVGFDPTRMPGDPDYGLLYTSGSDLGFSNGGGANAENPAQTQRLDTVITAILRFDPRSPEETGGTPGLGDYTIPPSNPFAGDAATLGEIYAYGFRNAHRMSWDVDGRMFALDIGMNHIEEVNIVRPGGNYGWMAREGVWENGRFRPGGALNQLYPLPPGVLDGTEPDGFIYPVAMYDHDEGRAISNGFAYRGVIEALRGKFVFGDVQAGRLFAADLAALVAADDGVPSTVAAIEEIQLYVRDADGNRRDVTFTGLVTEIKGEPVSRADLHLSQTADGELLVTSRQDGTIRQLMP